MHGEKEIKVWQTKATLFQWAARMTVVGVILTPGPLEEPSPMPPEVALILEPVL